MRFALFRVCAHAAHATGVWRSEDNFQEWDWVLSFSPVKSWSFLFLLHCGLEASWPPGS